MAKRSTTTKPKKKTTQSAARTPSTSSPGAMERQLLAFAEQLGYVAGSIQSKAGHVIDRETLNRQVSSVRDGAKHLLAQLAREMRTRVRRTPPPAPARKARSGGTVDAPGKKHRKPAPAGPPASADRSRNARVRTATPTAKMLTHRARQG